jgi:hypothetical protein
MNLTHSNMYQALECFGAGLAIAAGFVVGIALLIFLCFKIEAPVENWFRLHPRAGKSVVIGGWTLMASVACFCIFELGCSIMGAK